MLINNKRVCAISNAEECGGEMRRVLVVRGLSQTYYMCCSSINIHMASMCSQVSNGLAC